MARAGPGGHPEISAIIPNTSYFYGDFLTIVNFEVVIFLIVEYKLLSLTKFLQPLNLAIFTILSLFNLLEVPAPHLLSLFLARKPSPV